MHMISKNDLNSAELETLTTSRSPTTVITANGEVQTHEEATVYVKELNIFLTMMVFEDTPAVLSLGKLCDEHGYSYEWINGQKTHLIKNGIRIQCNTENFVPIVVPGLSSSSSSSLPSSTSMTLSRQEIDHPTSSSSSSTSAPMTSSTVSSESVDIQERGDPHGMDHHPAIVSSDPNQIKTKTTSQNVATRCIPKFRNGCKNSEKISWMTEFLNAETHTPVLHMNYLWSLWEVRIWVNTVLQGPHAEDAMAEPYLVLKIFVTW